VRAAVRGDALCSGSGDNAGTPCQRGGRRGDNHPLRVACGQLGGRRFPGRPVSMRRAGAGGRSGSRRLAHRWPDGRHAIR